jgi:hypothetical protein
MPTQPLPAHVDLDRLQATATLLRDLVRSGEPGAVALVHEHHPRLGDLTAGSDAVTAFRSADAQLVVARHHGLASWPELRAHVAVVQRLARSARGGGPPRGRGPTPTPASCGRGPSRRSPR